MEKSLPMSARSVRGEVILTRIISIIIASILLVLFFIGGYQIWFFRLKSAQDNLRNLAASTKRSTEILLENLARDLARPEEDLLRFELDSPQLRETLQAIQRGRTYILNFSVLDGQGVMRNTTRALGQGLGQDFSFREYYRFAPLGNNEAPFLGPAISSRIDGSLGFSLSRGYIKDGFRIVLNLFLDAQILLPQVTSTSGVLGLRAALFNQQDQVVFRYPWEQNLGQNANSFSPQELTRIASGLTLEGGFYTRYSIDGLPYYWVFYQSQETLFQDFILDYLYLSPFILVMIILVVYLDIRSSRGIRERFKSSIRLRRQEARESRKIFELKERFSRDLNFLNSLVSIRKTESTPDDSLKLSTIWLESIIVSLSSSEESLGSSSVELDLFLENLGNEWEANYEFFKGSFTYRGLQIPLKIPNKTASLLALLISEILFDHSPRTGDLELSVIYMESVRTLNFQFRGLSSQERFVPTSTLTRIVEVLGGGHFYDQEWNQLNVRVPLAAN